MGKGMGLGGHLRSAQDDGTYASSTRGVLNPVSWSELAGAAPAARNREGDNLRTGSDSRSESFHTGRILPHAARDLVTAQIKKVRNLIFAIESSSDVGCCVGLCCDSFSSLSMCSSPVLNACVFFTRRAYRTYTPEVLACRRGTALVATLRAVPRHRCPGTRPWRLRRGSRSMSSWRRCTSLRNSRRRSKRCAPRVASVQHMGFRPRAPRAAASSTQARRLCCVAWARATAHPTLRTHTRRVWPPPGSFRFGSRVVVCCARRPARVVHGLVRTHVAIS